MKSSCWGGGWVCGAVIIYATLTESLDIVILKMDIHKISAGKTFIGGYYQDLVLISQAFITCLVILDLVATDLFKLKF